MTKEPQAEQAPVEEKQESPTPSEEQKAPQVTEETPVPEKVEEAPKEPELPENVKERTSERFNELTAKLREERQRRLYLENIYQQIQQQPQTPVQQAPQLYDPNTGLLNEQALGELQRQVYDARNRAERAERQWQNWQLDQEERETYSVHPDLDPTTTKFNKTFHKQTRAILYDAMTHPEDYGGRQLSFKEAADLAKAINPKIVEKAKEEGAKQAMENLTTKEQASLEATGNPSRRTEVATDLDTLKRRSRKGDLSAIVERLKKIG